jgi:hypothetical protein
VGRNRGRFSKCFPTIVVVCPRSATYCVTAIGARPFISTLYLALCARRVDPFFILAARASGAAGVTTRIAAAPAGEKLPQAAPLSRRTMDAWPYSLPAPVAFHAHGLYASDRARSAATPNIPREEERRGHMACGVFKAWRCVSGSSVAALQELSDDWGHLIGAIRGNFCKPSESAATGGKTAGATKACPCRAQVNRLRRSDAAFGIGDLEVLGQLQPEIGFGSQTTGSQLLSAYNCAHLRSQDSSKLPPSSGWFSV